MRGAEVIIQGCLAIDSLLTVTILDTVLGRVESWELEVRRLESDRNGFVWRSGNILEENYEDSSMRDLESSEDLVQKFAAGKLFRLVSIFQGVVHLCVYLASFVKLISIEAGGYYNREILLFIGITVVSMPLFLITKLLIENSLKVSKQKRLIGYCFSGLVVFWSVVIIKLSYFS